MQQHNWSTTIQLLKIIDFGEVYIPFVLLLGILGSLLLQTWTLTEKFQLSLSLPNIVPSAFSFENF